MHLNNLIKDLKLPPYELQDRLLFFFRNYWPGCLELMRNKAPGDPKIIIDLLEQLDGVGPSSELRLFVRAHILLSKLCLDKNSRKAKLALKKTLRDL